MDGQVRYHRFRYHLGCGFATPEDTVLDIGSGSGYGTAMLSEVAKKVIGIEKEQPEIDAAIKNYKRSNNEFICGNLETMSLPEADVAVAFEVFEHLYKPMDFIEKLAGKVKKYIVFSVPVGQNLVWVEEANEYQQERDSTHKSVFATGHEIIDLLETLGWLELYYLRIGVTFIGAVYNPEFICD